jgi:hypothetical protein
MTDLVRFAIGAHDGKVFLYVFDLLELSGDDLRREPLLCARPRYGPCWSRRDGACD